MGPDFAQKAFARTPEDPFAGPILGQDSVYVIALVKKLPSEIPPLDQIRAQVEKDYQFAQALDLARKAGMAFYQTLTNGLAQGKTVAAICADAKLQLVEVPPFSLSTRELPQVEDHLPLNQFKQIAFTAPLGKVSPFQMTSRRRRHCLCEVQAAAGRGEHEREPSGVRQLCPPEPAKRGV